MKRREFITGLASAVAIGSAAAHAQPASKLRRVAMLWPMVGSEREPAEGGIRRLQELGWIDGQNLHIQWHPLAGMDRDVLRAQLAKLEATPPEIFWVLSNPVLAALQQVTRTTPIVFVQVADPVGSGFVESLGQARRQHHRLHQFRKCNGRKVDRDTEGGPPSTRNVWFSTMQRQRRIGGL